MKVKELTDAEIMFRIDVSYFPTYRPLRSYSLLKY